MPKKLHEIKGFDSGTVSALSGVDIPDDANTSSKDLENHSTHGKLMGRGGDKPYSLTNQFMDANTSLTKSSVTLTISTMVGNWGWHRNGNPCGYFMLNTPTQTYYFYTNAIIGTADPFSYEDVLVEKNAIGVNFVTDLDLLTLGEAIITDLKTAIEAIAGTPFTCGDVGGSGPWTLTITCSDTGVVENGMFENGHNYPVLINETGVTLGVLEYSETSGVGISFDAASMATINRKTSTDIVYLDPNNGLSRLSDIYGESSSSLQFLNEYVLNAEKLSMIPNNQELHIGVGGSGVSDTLWAGYTSIGNTVYPKGTYAIEKNKLATPASTEAGGEIFAFSQLIKIASDDYYMYGIIKGGRHIYRVLVSDGSMQISPDLGYILKYITPCQSKTANNESYLYAYTAGTESLDANMYGLNPGDIGEILLIKVHDTNNVDPDTTEWNFSGVSIYKKYRLKYASDESEGVKGNQPYPIHFTEDETPYDWQEDPNPQVSSILETKASGITTDKEYVLWILLSPAKTSDPDVWFRPRLNSLTSEGISDNSYGWDHYPYLFRSNLSIDLATENANGNTSELEMIDNSIFSHYYDTRSNGWNDRNHFIGSYGKGYNNNKTQNMFIRSGPPTADRANGYGYFPNENTRTIIGLIWNISHYKIDGNGSDYWNEGTTCHGTDKAQHFDIPYNNGAGTEDGAGAICRVYFHSTDTGDDTPPTAPPHGKLLKVEIEDGDSVTAIMVKIKDAFNASDNGCPNMKMYVPKVAQNYAMWIVNEITDWYDGSTPGVDGNIDGFNSYGHPIPGNPHICTSGNQLNGSDESTLTNPGWGSELERLYIHIFKRGYTTDDADEVYDGYRWRRNDERLLGKTMGIHAGHLGKWKAVTGDSSGFGSGKTYESTGVSYDLAAKKNIIGDNNYVAYAPHEYSLVESNNISGANSKAHVVSFAMSFKSIQKDNWDGDTPGTWIIKNLRKSDYASFDTEKELYNNTGTLASADIDDSINSLFYIQGEKEINLENKVIIATVKATNNHNGLNGLVPGDAPNVHSMFSSLEAGTADGAFSAFSADVPMPGIELTYATEDNMNNKDALATIRVIDDFKSDGTTDSFFPERMRTLSHENYNGMYSVDDSNASGKQIFLITRGLESTTIPDNFSTSIWETSLEDIDTVTIKALDKLNYVDFNTESVVDDGDNGEINDPNATPFYHWNPTADGFPVFGIEDYNNDGITKTLDGGGHTFDYKIKLFDRTGDFKFYDIFWDSLDAVDGTEIGESTNLGSIKCSDVTSFIGTITGSGTTSETFAKTITYNYKLSFMYDGYQESPLTHTPWTFKDDSNNYDSLLLPLQIYITNKRLTHINIYRTDNVNKLYRLAKQVPIDDSWTPVLNLPNVYSKTIVDTGKSGATYEALNNMSESLRNTSMNYGISTTLNSELYAGQCWHPDIQNAENYIFRSNPGKYSQFDWITNYMILPEYPLAIKGFRGRVYAFSESNMYVINSNMQLEDTYEGIGCLSQESIVTSDAGMCFADNNNIYLFNGDYPKVISGAIEEDYQTDLNSETYKPIISYDSIRHSFVVSIKSDTLWVYNVMGRRWDKWSTPGNGVLDSMLISTKAEVLFADSVNKVLYSLASDNSNRKSYDWKSKKISMGVDTQDKFFKRTRITGVTSNVLDSVSTSKGVISGTYTGDTDNSKYSYPVSANRKAKWIQYTITGETGEIDSIGTIYRDRSIR